MINPVFNCFQKFTSLPARLVFEDINKPQQSTETAKSTEIAKPTETANQKLKKLEKNIKKDNIVTECKEALKIQEYINNFVEENYDRAIAVLPAGVTNPPSQEEVKNLLADQLTLEQFEVIKAMDKPVLQIISLLTSGKEYINNIMKHNGSEDALNAPEVQDQVTYGLNRADIRHKNLSTNFQIAITEGAESPRILSKDNKELPIEDRNELFQKYYESKGVSGIDLKRMIDLITQSIKEDKKIDQRTWSYVMDMWGHIVNWNLKEWEGTFTIINGEPNNNLYRSSLDPEASKYDFCRFKPLPPHYRNHRHGDNYLYFDQAGRFRPSVVINMP